MVHPVFEACLPFAVMGGGMMALAHLPYVHKRLINTFDARVEFYQDLLMNRNRYWKYQFFGEWQPHPELNWKKAPFSSLPPVDPAKPLSFDDAQHYFYSKGFGHVALERNGKYVVIPQRDSK